MAAVKGSIGGANGYNPGSAQSWGHVRPWERTPWRHWRRWFGYTWCRHWGGGVSWDGTHTVYQTERQRARQAIEEAYAPSSPASQEATRDYPSQQYGSSPTGRRPRI